MSEDSGKKPVYWMPRQPKSPAEGADLAKHPNTFQLSYPAMLRARVAEILDEDLGFGISARLRKSVSADGSPIPLMSYGFVEYVAGLDLSSFSVLEFGGGNSTLFWADRTRSVLTFEHDRGWHGTVEGQMPANVDLRLIDQDAYAKQAASLDQSFDLIIIDCAASRYDCAKAIEGKLAAGGLVVLDNSDWYPNTAAALREQGLIQVDFPDFRPDHWIRCCTSIFLHSEFRPKPRQGQLPLPVIGGKLLAEENGWDKPS